MKRYIILIINLFSLSIIGCYEDKGNYKYKEIVEIESVDNLPNSLQVSGFDTLKIYPEINSNYPDEYDFQWILYIRDSATQVLSTVKDLEYYVALPAGGKYSILYVITSKTTGIDYRYRMNLNVFSNTGYGWYLLKKIYEETEIDYFSDVEAIKSSDILYNTYGKRMRGEPKRLSYLSGYYDYDDATHEGKVTKQNRLFILSENDIFVYNTATAEVIRNSAEHVFYIPPTLTNYQRIFTNIYDFYLMNDNKMYTIYSSTSNVGKFGSEMTHPNGPVQDYKLSQYTSGFRYSGPIVFDELSSTFLYSSQNSAKFNYFQEKEGEISLTNMDYNLLYMGTTIVPNLSGSPITTACALMKHKQLDDYKMLYLNINNNSSYPVSEIIDIDSNAELFNSDIKAMSSDIKAMYYVHGNDVKLFNFYDGSSTIAFNIPTGEKINFIQVDNYDPTSYVIIGTIIGERYKVYIFKPDSNTGVLSDLQRTLEGEGEAAYVKSVNRGVDSMSN